MVLDDDAAALRVMGKLARDLLGREVEECETIEALDTRLRPPGKLTARRIRVRGFVIDWFLGRESALDVLAWLDGVYPRTPVLIYTGTNDADAIGAACAARGLRFRTVAAASSPGLPRPLPAIVGDALLGFVMTRGRPLVVVRKGPCMIEVLSFFDEHVFAPWDERCIEAREYVLAMASAGEHFPERLLCVLDCAFDGVPVGRLPHARGVTKRTSNSDLSEIYAAFGGISGVDCLTSPYFLDRVGRGPAYAARDAWSTLVDALSDWEP